MVRSDSPAPFRNPHNTLYAKLGISSDASAQDIQSAYKVLEQAYRPGGAYVDDVMHLAFMEISKAASILSNPKTRKLYDRGYIDESGKRTKAGLARTSRVRTGLFAGAFLSIGFAGLVVFSIGHSNGPLESVAKRAAKPHLPVSMPRPTQETQNSVSRKSGSHVPPLQADAGDYLPPETKDEPGNHGGHDSPKSLRAPGAPHLAAAPKSSPDRRRLARLSRTGPRMWQSYIWFGGPPPTSEPGRASQTLKSARCLACLTDHQADCSRACP